MNGVWTVLVTYNEIYLKNNTFENLIIKKSDFLNYYQKQMIRTSLLNGVINLDSDFSKYIESLSNPWVIEGFNVQDWVVKPWKARVKAERTNGETIYCYVENTEDVSLSWNDGKVYIVIDQEDIDSGLVSEDWSNIARIEEGDARPVKNFLKIWSKNGGIIKDEREMIKKIQDIDSEAQEQIDSLDERMTDAEDEIEEIKSTSIENIGNLVVDWYFIDDVQKWDIVNFYYNKKNTSWSEYHTAWYWVDNRTPYLYYFSKESNRKYNLSVMCRWSSPWWSSGSSFTLNSYLYYIDNWKPWQLIWNWIITNFNTTNDKKMWTFMLWEYNDATWSWSSSTSYNSTYLFKFTPTKPTKIESLTKTTGVIFYDEDMQQISSLNWTILEQGESFYVRYPKNTSNTRYIANSSITNFNIESYKCLTEWDIFWARQSSSYASTSRVTDDITFVARRTFTVSDFYSYSTSYWACSVELSDWTTFVLTWEYTFEEWETYILHMSDLYQRNTGSSAIDDRQEFMNITSTKKDNAYRVFKIKSYEWDEIRIQKTLSDFYGISLFKTCNGLVFQNALINFWSSSSSYSWRIGKSSTNWLPFIKQENFENDGFWQTDWLNAIFMKRRQVYDPNQQVWEIYIAKNNYSAWEVWKAIKYWTVNLWLDFDWEVFIGPDWEYNSTVNAWWISLGINNSEAWLNLNPYLVTREETIVTQKTEQLNITEDQSTNIEYFTFTIDKPWYYKLSDSTKYYITTTVFKPDWTTLYTHNGTENDSTTTTSKYYRLEEWTYTVKVKSYNTSHNYTRSILYYKVTFQNAFMDQN